MELQTVLSCNMTPFLWRQSYSLNLLFYVKSMTDQTNNLNKVQFSESTHLLGLITGAWGRRY